MNEDTHKQLEKQLAPRQPNPFWLKEYQWQKGQSGNPAGRPKRQTLKEFAREFLFSMSDEARLEYFQNVSPDFVWRMAEGNPEDKLKVAGGIIHQIVGMKVNKEIQKQEGKLID